MEYVNPKLAEEIMTAATEGKVLKIINSISLGKAANDDVFNQPMSA